METPEIHGQSGDESARNGPSVISRAMALDRCPRCGKTFQGPMLLAHAKAEEYLIGLIKRDHPEWIEPGGTCPGCVAYYRVLVERTGV